MTNEQTPPTRFSDDWLKEEREHERQMAQFEAAKRADENRERRLIREHRTSRVAIVSSALAVTACILGIVWAIWSSTSESRAKTERLETTCIEQGGTWTTIGGAMSPTCVQFTDIEQGDPDA